MKIASAPMFFMKAENTATRGKGDDLQLATGHIRRQRTDQRLGSTRARHCRTDDQGRPDDDHNVVAEASEGVLGFDDAGDDCR
jgi:hypothetical protein